MSRIPNRPASASELASFTGLQNSLVRDLVDVVDLRKLEAAAEASRRTFAREIAAKWALELPDCPPEDRAA